MPGRTSWLIKCPIREVDQPNEKPPQRCWAVALALAAFILRPQADVQIGA
jgi:hypothetical protein